MMSASSDSVWGKKIILPLEMTHHLINTALNPNSVCCLRCFLTHSGLGAAGLIPVNKVSIYNSVKKKIRKIPFALYFFSNPNSLSPNASQ